MSSDFDAVLKIGNMHKNITNQVKEIKYERINKTIAGGIRAFQ
jgi:hypothetical protein